MSRINTNFEFNIRAVRIDSRLTFSASSHHRCRFARSFECVSIIIDESHTGSSFSDHQRWLMPLTIERQKKNCHQCPENQREHTAFRSHAAAGEPVRALNQDRIEKVSRNFKATIIHAKEK